MDFSQIIKKLVEQNSRIAVHYGVVTDTNVTPDNISVEVSGSDTAIEGVRYLDSYSPTVSDVVVLIVSKGDIFVLGKLA